MSGAAWTQQVPPEQGWRHLVPTPLDDVLMLLKKYKALGELRSAKCTLLSELLGQQSPEEGHVDIAVADMVKAQNIINNRGADMAATDGDADADMDILFGDDVAADVTADVAADVAADVVAKLDMIGATQENPTRAPIKRGRLKRDRNAICKSAAPNEKRPLDASGDLLTTLPIRDKQSIVSENDWIEDTFAPSLSTDVVPEIPIHQSPSKDEKLNVSENECDRYCMSNNLEATAVKAVGIRAEVEETQIGVEDSLPLFCPVQPGFRCGESSARSAELDAELAKAATQRTRAMRRTRQRRNAKQTERNSKPSEAEEEAKTKDFKIHRGNVPESLFSSGSEVGPTPQVRSPLSPEPSRDLKSPNLDFPKEMVFDMEKKTDRLENTPLPFAASAGNVDEEHNTDEVLKTRNVIPSTPPFLIPKDHFNSPHETPPLQDKHLLSISKDQTMVPPSPADMDASKGQTEVPPSPSDMDASKGQTVVPQSPSDMDASKGQTVVLPSPSDMDASKGRVVVSSSPSDTDASKGRTVAPPSPSNTNAYKDQALISLSPLDIEATKNRAGIPLSPLSMDASKDRTVIPPSPSDIDTPCDRTTRVGSLPSNDPCVVVGQSHLDTHPYAKLCKLPRRGSFHSPYPSGTAHLESFDNKLKTCEVQMEAESDRANAPDELLPSNGSIPQSQLPCSPSDEAEYSDGFSLRLVSEIEAGGPIESVQISSPYSTSGEEEEEEVYVVTSGKIVGENARRWISAWRLKAQSGSAGSGGGEVGPSPLGSLSLLTRRAPRGRGGAASWHPAEDQPGPSQAHVQILEVRSGSLVVAALGHIDAGAPRRRTDSAAMLEVVEFSTNESPHPIIQGGLQCGPSSEELLCLLTVPQDKLIFGASSQGALHCWRLSQDCTQCLSCFQLPQATFHGVPFMELTQLALAGADRNEGIVIGCSRTGSCAVWDFRNPSGGCGTLLYTCHMSQHCLVSLVPLRHLQGRHAQTPTKPKNTFQGDEGAKDAELRSIHMMALMRVRRGACSLAVSESEKAADGFVEEDDEFEPGMRCSFATIFPGRGMAIGQAMGAPDTEVVGEISSVDSLTTPFVVVGCRSGQVLIWNPITGHCRASLSTKNGASVSSFASCERSSHFIVGSRDSLCVYHITVCDKT